MCASFREHFLNPQNRGEIVSADGSGKAGDTGCGAVISLQIKFAGQEIAAAGFNASGSAEVIAAGSILTGMIGGKHWREAAAIAPAVIERMLAHEEETDESGPARAGAARQGRIGQAADFAIEALHAALEDSIRRARFPESLTIEPNTALVAMSGGVDSTVACLLTGRSGQQVTGVTMRLWSDPACETPVGAPSCCSPQAIRDARAACHRLGLPHLTVDYRQKFETEVVDYFTREYLDGRTPNPCTHCNGDFRFPELVTLADRLGAEKVVTGHYVRIVGEEGSLSIARGVDGAKDQSYMLWAVPRDLLKRITFPLGGMEKGETRSLARQAGLEAHARPESQEICFIPDNDYRRFIKSRVINLPGNGEVISSAGEKLGTHGGYLNFTIGQRRGLGIGGAEPLYVLKTLPEENIVIAGAHDELAVRRLTLNNIIGQTSEERTGTDKFSVQVRYNSPAVTCRITQTTKDEWEINLDDPVYGVAAGQSAVIYEGDVVAAGGIITSTR